MGWQVQGLQQGYFWEDEKWTKPHWFQRAYYRFLDKVLLPLLLVMHKLSYLLTFTLPYTVLATNSGCNSRTQLWFCIYSPSIKASYRTSLIIVLIPTNPDSSHEQSRGKECVVIIIIIIQMAPRMYRYGLMLALHYPVQLNLTFKITEPLMPSW